MNTQNPILGASGRPMFQVGGPNARAVHQHGDYLVSLEWLNEGRESEPIMVIWSAHAGRESGAFGICLSSAGKYAEPTGAPTDECFFEAFEALETLGRARLNSEVKKLVDTIMRFIPDLIMMPPSPRDVRLADAGQALIEASIVDTNGKTLREAEL